jgi:hypothetical protein
VFAVLALVNESCWDPEKQTLKSDIRFEIGRRMTTSAANRISASTNVRPDCVLQFDEKLGLVAEAKLGLPKSDEMWDEDIKQLEKYDDNLSGWWTADEHIAKHDLVALVPLPRAVRFSDRLDSGVRDGKWTFERNVAVVGFFKTSGVKDFLSLKKERGALSLKDLDQRLRESRQIAIDRLILKYKDRKFVDHMPPLPYLLQIMWDHLFTRYAADVQESESDGAVSLSLSVEKVTKDLQEYFGFASTGARSPEIPPLNWVRKAFDALVSSKLALKKGDTEYIIAYKRTRGDTLRKFGKMCFDLDQKQMPVPKSQLSLLQAGPSHGEPGIES